MQEQIEQAVRMLDPPGLPRGAWGNVAHYQTLINRALFTEFYDLDTTANSDDFPSEVHHMFDLDEMAWEKSGISGNLFVDHRQLSTTRPL